MELFLGDKLKAIRKELRLTLEAFAEPIGSSKANLSQIETGRGKPSDSLVKFICQTYNVNRGYLFGEDVPMFKSAIPRRPKQIENNKGVGNEDGELWLLTENEKLMIEIFRDLDGEQQAGLMRYARIIPKRL